MDNKPKDPIKESRKRKMQKPLPFPPKDSKSIVPGVYQLGSMIYVGDKC